ncbi:MAG: iron dicitrate transport regulator FecR, partial [Bacteroidales bacterium]|nr:iron dicitrate transport regulator FecR [Bacteroidales bacterium]
MNLEEIQSIINREANAILNIPVTEQYNKAVDLIV